MNSFAQLSVLLLLTSLVWASRVGPQATADPLDSESFFFVFANINEFIILYLFLLRDNLKKVNSWH